MNKLVMTGFLVCVGCGYSAKANEMVGQVKKVVERTPIVCGDFVEADISLGVMRNGIGSMSHEDVEVYVPEKEDVMTLKKAAETGALVRVSYDRARVTLCVPNDVVTHVEIMQ